MKHSRSRGPSLWRRSLRAISATTAAILVVGAGTALGATTAHAAPNAAISIIPTATASTPHGQFDPFQYVIDFSCSGASGAGCANMEIRVPVTLEPRAGQVERFDQWTLAATLSNSNAASFTQSWERTSTGRTLVLRAKGVIAAGLQEALSLSITPADWVGDGVRFTVGAAELTTSNGDTARSNTHTATVTNIPLHDPTITNVSGYAESPTSNAQWVTYSFDPYLNNIITATGTTHVFGTGDVHTSTTPNITAQYETVELSVVIPAGATVPTLNAQFAQRYDPSTRTLTFTAPANRATTDTIRFTLHYPAEMAGENVTLSANRTFVGTNGDTYSADASVTHRLDYRPLPEGELGKCGMGSTAVTDASLVGMCSSTVILPQEWSAQGTSSLPVTGSYRIEMHALAAGDSVEFTDFMPCFERSGTSVLTESFESQEICADPAVRITGVKAYTAVREGGTLIPLTTDVSYTLRTNDGATSSASTPVSAAFPAAPAVGTWHGISATVSNMPHAGVAYIVIEIAAMPGVDREMMLENYASAVVTRSIGGGSQSYPSSPVGVIRVMDIITGTSRANMSYTNGNAYATVNGAYTVDHLDPNQTLPVYYMQLPAGFEPRNGDLSTFQVRYNGTGVRYTLTDHFDVTIVPEDTATNTGPRLVMVPRAGTTAIPTGGGAWSQAGVSGQIAPTWGEWNTRQTLRIGTSLNGDSNRIDACTGGSAMRGADGDDLDGDGVTTFDPTCDHSYSALLGTPNPAATAVATKAVRDAGSTAWVTGTDPATIGSGEMEYLINWRNAGTPTLTDVVLYDLLPHTGDTGATTVTTGLGRGSTYQPVFSGLVGAAPSGVEVQYSASANPCRPEVLPTNPGCDDDWTADTAGLGGDAAVTALRISLPGNQITGTTHSLVFGMTVPGEAIAGDLAWNTVAHRALLNGTPMNPAETARVGALVPSNVSLSKSLAPGTGGESEYSVGDVLTYTLTAYNEYGAGVENVQLTDDLTEVLAHASFTGDAVASSGTVDFDVATSTLTWIGDLGPLERATITYSVTATSPSVGAVVNRVVGSANEEPTNCATGDEDGCSAGGSIIGVPSISIDKVSTNVAEGDTVLSGTVVSWNYIVTNTGNEDLRLSSLTDDRRVLVTCPDRILAVGASTVCTGQGSVAGDPTYTNVGTVHAVGIDTDRAVSDSDTWSTPIEQLSPAIEVVKTAEGVEEGSVLEPNQTVIWQYVVTNTGTDSFETITVTDDRGVRVECPNPVNLEPGDSATCTGTGTVGYAASYTNVATATGVGSFSGETAQDTDDWSASVRQQSIGLQIDKLAVGVAETDTVIRNTVIDWQYVVTNPGAEPIGSITVSDDQGVPVTCPLDELAPGASMTCTGSGSVGAGDSYTNVGTATGTSTLTGREVAAEDPWSVLVRDLVPELTIVKGASNAVDGGSVLAGTEVRWNYTVQNTGEEAIHDLVVVDDQGVEVTCPVTELAVGEITTCTGSAIIGNVGSYTNVGTATGEGSETGTPVEAEDEWITDVEEPTTTAVISKNSADAAYGSTLTHGTEVTWEYTVTNTGSEQLVRIVVVDDMGVEVACPADALAPGESMVCTGTGSVGAGDEYTNIGSVTAVGAITGHPADDADAWTVLLTPPAGEEPGTTGPNWPEAPVGGGTDRSAHALVVTGGVGLAALGATGIAVLLLGIGLLLASRRRVNG